jgi:16S rRNA (adenine1518-N6/adenine1519-N6)-dimethyltransferase
MSKKIRELLDRHYITPDMDLDQHFFKNVHVLQKMVGYAKVNKDSSVLEIGAGLGFLTKQLAKKAGLVIAVERDRRFEDVLKEELSGYDNVELVFDNALKLKNVKVDSIVSNLPYNLCEPLLKVLPKWKFDRAVLLVSRKFAFGLLTSEELKKKVRVWNVELLDDVSKKCFFPQPRTESKLVRLTPL